MADKLVIQNFKYGLDARRDEIVSQPGTLIQLENGHINQGSEIEKRKAFVLFSQLGILDSNGDQGTFWGESTDSGIMCFGSAIDFGGSVTQGQPTLASAIPVTSPVVVYQQLQHPAVVDGDNYDRDVHLMIGVEWSTVYKGKAFVIGKFVDGSRFLYYDGELVQQSRAGIVLTGRTSLANLGTELAREFNELDGWTAVANGDSFTGGVSLITQAVTGVGTGATLTVTVSNAAAVTAVVGSSGGTLYVVGDIVLVKDATGSGVLFKVKTIAGSAIATVELVYGGFGAFSGLDVVKSPLGTTFGITPTTNSVLGLQGGVEIDTNAPAFGATAARTYFTLIGTNGHVSVTAPKNVDGTGIVNLATAVAFHTSLSLTSADICTAINQGTIFHGYSAVCTGAVITITAPLVFGNVTFNLTVTDVDGDLSSSGAGAPSSNLSLSLNPGTTTKTRIGTGGATINVVETATISGGVAPYTYAWAEQIASGGGIIGSGNGIAISNSTGASSGFYRGVAQNTTVTGTFKCTVTDSTGATAVVNFSITLENETNN